LTLIGLAGLPVQQSGTIYQPITHFKKEYAMRRTIRMNVELYIDYEADDPDVTPSIREALIDEIPVKIDGVSALGEYIRDLAQEDAEAQLTPVPTEEDYRNYMRSR
jgi:hypothetical protein